MFVSGLLVPYGNSFMLEIGEFCPRVSISELLPAWSREVRSVSCHHAAAVIAGGPRRPLIIARMPWNTARGRLASAIWKTA